ncbi:hypothetical protein Klosneuvirus_6_93 [Klosneuvirus KNV1]|uniref:Uncharacterized protein n=1 Tax=Klosneuvirus KNV1 TaxID=1977640 RepID=A0A1V0SLI7_9VIRU|nr:hypothetical protein Klosneuvirus_6_93 [Klosneuvirus KNV1]
MFSRGITRVLKTNTRVYSSESNFNAYKALKSDKVFHVTMDPEEYFKIMQQNKDMKVELDQLDKISVPFTQWYKQYESEYGKLKFVKRNEISRLTNELGILQAQKKHVSDVLERLGYNEFKAYDEYSNKLRNIEASITHNKNKLRDIE